jgi:hypothetical protein
MIKFGRIYDNYVIFIIIIKILFLITAITARILQATITNTTTANTNLINIYNILFEWKHIFEFIFIISLAFIIIIIFCPFYGDNVFINKHTRILLFTYGFIIILRECESFELKKIDYITNHTQNKSTTN